MAQPETSTPGMTRSKCSQATKWLSHPNSAPGFGKSEPDWPRCRGGRVGRTTLADRALYGRPYIGRPPLSGSDHDANVAHDHRDAHLQDQTRPANGIPGDIRIEERARADKNQDENPGTIFIGGRCRHLFLYARFSRSRKPRPAQGPVLRRQTLERRTRAKTDADDREIRRGCRRSRRRPRPLAVICNPPPAI